MVRVRLLFLALVAALVCVVGVSTATANTTPQTLPYGPQTWANTAMITVNDDWSNVPGIEGFLGDDASTTAAGADPQTKIEAAWSTTIDVIANQTAPNTLTNGGVAEFHIADPVVALQGSGTADYPNLVLTLDTTGASAVTVAYDVRDIDCSADNAVQAVALQYRVGTSGNFTNVPAGFVADATTGGSLCTLVTPVSAALPAAASNQSTVQVRIITANAAGNDEWVGIDNISVTNQSPSLTINDVSQAETDAGTTTFTFTVSLSHPAPAGGVTFDIATADGTATDGIGEADTDYVAQSLTGQSIPAGSTGPYQFNVTVNGDVTVESNETFFVNVTNVTGANVGDGQGQGTIQNDDSPPTPNLTVNDVTKAEGNAGTTTFTFTVSLDSPAGAGGVTFDIATQDGTANDGVGEAETDYAAKSLTSQTIAQGNQQYMFSVDVNGDVAVEANETFFVNVTNVTGANVSDGQGLGTITNDDVTLTPIHSIQGATHISPYVGQSVTTTGIVTAKTTNGFWMQDQDANADADVATSEGIFVFTSSAPSSVNVGDALQVTATVSEFRPGGVSSTNLTTTELATPTIVVQSSGNSLPTATVIGAGGRTPPTMVIEDDATGSPPDVEDAGSTFDPANDGIDFYESLEAMRVQVNDAVAVGPTNGFGELPVLADNGTGASVRTTRGGIVVRSNDFNPERIILDDPILGTSMFLANVGDTFPGATVGVMDYSFGNFKLLATTMPSLLPGGLMQEQAAIPSANEISIGTFNVENLDPGDGPAKFNALAAELVNNLRSPDIVALEEVQDNNGPTNDSTTDATTTFNTLISAITSAGGPTYAFTQIDPVDDQDGGEPGGNIRVGFIYRTDRGLSFVSKPGATSTTANTVGPGGLQYSPGRIDPTNTAFNSSRKPLAAEFMWNTQKLYLIANHWNSKGGDEPLFGRHQPPTLSSEVQRNQQAAVVNNFVDDILANDAQAQIVVLGDFNDFEFSNPLKTLTDNGTVLHDMYFLLPQSERYSYVFDGNSQALDHILGSTQVSSRMPVYDVVHANSEFANQISDHEPQVLRYDPENQPTAAEVTRFTAQRTKAGVLVKWRTANESRIAGFNVYRERAGKLVRVNRALIRAKAAGTAAGRAYAWRDALAKPGARYRLQVVRLDGTRVWRGSARS